MVLTKKLVYAICADVFAAARRSGKISEQASLLHDQEFDRLVMFVGGPSGWVDLPAE